MTKSKLGKLLSLVYELGIKESSAIGHAAWNYMRHRFSRSKTVERKSSAEKKSSCRVILLLHGQGGGAFCFRPLVKRLHQAGHDHVFTIGFKPSLTNPAPTEPLLDKLQELNDYYTKIGYEKVNFVLIGHSLGAIIAANAVWHHNFNIEMCVSIAGRLRYVDNHFAWFCSDVRSVIEKTYDAIASNPGKTALFTIRGERDNLVPKESVHIQGNPARQYTQKGYGHGGIIYARGVHNKIIEWLNSGDFS